MITCTVVFLWEIQASSISKEKQFQAS